MNQTYHRHTFGRADLSDLHTLLDWLAQHEDKRLVEGAATVASALDGADLEMERGDWVWLSNTVDVFAGAHAKLKLRDLCHRLYAIRWLLIDVLKREPSRTVEVEEPAAEPVDEPGRQLAMSWE